MDSSLRLHFRLFLMCIFTLGASLPAFASDQRTSPRRIRILKVSKIGEKTPNIITGKTNLSEANTAAQPKPDTLEPQENVAAPIEEVATEKPSVIKTLKLGARKTKTIKTTKETIPLAAAPAPEPKKTKEKAKPAPRTVPLPAAPDYCDANQHGDIIKAAYSEKDIGLAQSLRTYMKAQERDPALIDALYEAAQETGVSFELMVIKAMVESNLGANTVASKSSARGIFQYIDPTWLSLIKRHGKKIGYENYANVLEYDPATKRYDTYRGASISREEILSLRDNVKAASLIKAYQIIDEQAVLKEYKEGNAPTITDHYIMHMLGLPLSRTLYRLKNSNSRIVPASLKNGMFNQAIAANPSFFYDENKNALNAPQIYGRFAKTTGAKIDVLRAIDSQYGSGQNVTAQNCTPIPFRPRIHTPSVSKFQNVSAPSSVSEVEPAAGPANNYKPKKHTKKHKNISSVALLQFEPSPITMQD